MSLQTIVLDSSREVLTEMLAPDVADGLARRIVERAMSRVDEAVGDFFGSDLGKEAGGRRRSAKNKLNGRANLGELDENAKISEGGEAKLDTESEELAA